MIDKIKKCIIAGYDSDIINREELENLWTYITNLQQENERLKIQLRSCDELLDNDTLMIDIYKSRIYKAIEKLKYYSGGEAEYYVPMDYIIKILKGDNND